MYIYKDTIKGVIESTIAKKKLAGVKDIDFFIKQNGDKKEFVGHVIWQEGVNEDFYTEIDGLKNEKYILTKSINCCAYIMYQHSTPLDFYKDSKTGNILFKFRKNENNKESYNKYKETVMNQNKLEVDIIRFNKIIHYIKKKTREFRENN